jgi:uncharacterized surface protein with fasciclin (FAS1) repeats
MPHRFFERHHPMSIMSNTPSTTNTRNLVDTAAANDSFKTFSKAVESAGLADTLRGTGPFTVFAPTDAAFAKLPSGRLDNLLKPENKDELTSLLNYHVVTGRKTAADVGKWESARTVNGQQAPIKMVDGKLTIDGAQLITADIGTSNGLIHGIDKVNIPTKQ